MMLLGNHRNCARWEFEGGSGKNLLDGGRDWAFAHAILNGNFIRQALLMRDEPYDATAGSELLDRRSNDFQRVVVQSPEALVQKERLQLGGASGCELGGLFGQRQCERERRQEGLPTGQSAGRTSFRRRSGDRRSRS